MVLSFGNLRLCRLSNAEFFNLWDSCSGDQSGTLVGCLEMVLLRALTMASAESLRILHFILLTSSTSSESFLASVPFSLASAVLNFLTFFMLQHAFALLVIIIHSSIRNVNILKNKTNN